MNETGSYYDLMMGIVKSIGDIVWGLPTIIMLVGTGIWLTIRLKGLQFTKLGYSLYLA